MSTRELPKISCCYPVCRSGLTIYGTIFSVGVSIDFWPIFMDRLSVSCCRSTTVTYEQGSAQVIMPQILSLRADDGFGNRGPFVGPVLFWWHLTKQTRKTLSQVWLQVEWQNELMSDTAVTIGGNSGGFWKVDLEGCNRPFWMDFSRADHGFLVPLQDFLLIWTAFEVAKGTWCYTGRKVHIQQQ